MQAEQVMRMTKQRQVILDELRQLTCHPTADEMYDRIRKRLPKVSLGTVYRNLEIMSEQGIIQKLDVGGSKKRFDGNVVDHCHIRCTRCGRLEDMECHFDFDLAKVAAVATNYQVMRYRLEVIGVCPSCQGAVNGEVKIDMASTPRL